MRPEEAETIPLTPGRNVYIVRDASAQTPSLAWTIEVPARPKARKIALPENDLQYVFLSDDREWDPEPICARETVDDFPCGVPEVEDDIPGGYWPNGGSWGARARGASRGRGDVDAHFGGRGSSRVARIA